MKMEFGNIIPNNAHQVLELAKKMEEQEKYQKFIENEPIRQNDKIIELTKETNEIVKQLKEDIKRPSVKDYIVAMLAFLTLIFTVLQFLK